MMLQAKEALDSRKELIPVVETENGLMVDSRLLHRKLNVQDHHRNWIDRRIREYDFTFGTDYVSFYKSDFRANLRENLTINDLQGRKSKAFLLTIDMARELAMVEKTDEGRMVRRYFIEVEKRYREWFSFVLPRLHCIKTLFEQGNYFNYPELLMTIGCSTTSSSVRKRIRKNPQEFIRENNLYYVSEQYGRTIYVNAFVRKLNAETAERRLCAANNELTGGPVPDTV